MNSHLCRWTILLAMLIAPLFVVTPANAYPWMIRHGYTGCAVCHSDPSGGAGALTEYGRAQSDTLLIARYAQSKDGEEPSRASGFLFGLAPVPSQLRLGGDLREAFLRVVVPGAPAVNQFITMRADLTADMKAGRLRVAGNIGVAPQGDLPAALTSKPSDNVISREHWIGAELDEEAAWLVRGGRLALPFGIRMIEHTLWTRTLTQTDIDDTQQYGVALAFAKEQLRGEVMGIAGNFEIHPDFFRQRGYSGFVEYAPTTTFAFGISSLFTRATRDVVFGVTDYRYANGVFGRYSPVRALVLLAEADSIYQSLTWHGHRGGFASFVQADYEPVQGYHLMLTGEAMNGGASGEPTSIDAWASMVWFFLPHADLRLDAIESRLGAPPSAMGAASSTNVTTWLAQLHLFL